MTGQSPLLDLASTIELILGCLRSEQSRDVSGYGYDVCPANAAYNWARKIDSHKEGELCRQYGHLFYDAAWQLCRRGLLRPGVRTLNQQAVDDWGYSLTPIGREWISNPAGQIEVLEAGSLARVLGGYRERFGDGFFQRSQEAIRCRNSEAWLACCSMTGAASESILLCLAIAKVGNEGEVLAQYYSRSGRRKVLNLLTGNKLRHLANQLETFMGLLAYWRDEAAHGQLSDLSVANADEALRQLLHLAQWADRNWDQLTRLTEA